MTKASANKFTFDTEFSGSEDRRAPAARARQKQTLTIEELENLQTLARLEGENNAKARTADALERGMLIAADPAMTGADCRIEWRGGGAERSENTIEEALAALIAHRFSHQVKG